MSDRVFIDSGTNTPISTDWVNRGGEDEHVQYVKIMSGKDGDISVVSGDSVYGLDVNVTRLPSFSTTVGISGNQNIGISGGTVNVAGTFWQATQPISGMVGISGDTNVGISGGSLNVTIVGGSTSGPTYIGGGAGSATATGTVILGTDNTYARVLKTDADGHLQVDVLTGTLTVSTIGITGGSLTVGISGNSNIGITGGLPTGTNNIGTVNGSSINVTGGSVTIAAGTANIGNVGITGGTLPVTGIFYQATQPISGTVGISGYQNVCVTGGNVTIAAGTANIGNVGITGGTLPVTGIFYQATQPISGTVGISGGENIGVSGVVPGIGATNLGKQKNTQAGSNDVGVAIFGKIKGEDIHTTDDDGDYDLFSLTSFHELRTRDQRAVDINNCNDSSLVSGLSNDTTGIANSANHIFGVSGLTFNKVDGSDNSIYGGVYKYLPSAINIAEIFEAGGFVGLGTYLPSLTNIVNVFLRIGTDSTNYNCWTWPVANLTAATWLNLRTAAASPDYSKNAGAGWNTDAISYVAFGVEFSAETNTLSGICFDHVHIVGGRVTSADTNATIATSVSSPNVNILKVGNTVVDTSNGAVSAGTQRVTIADNSTGRLNVAVTGGSITIAAGTANIGNVGITGGTLPVTGTFYQATQPISGTVGISGYQNVCVTGGSITIAAGTANIGNVGITGGTLPVTGVFYQATQPISGTVGISGYQNVCVTGGSITIAAGTANIGNVGITGGTLPVTGVFYQATQPISGTVGISGYQNVCVTGGSITIAAGTANIGNVGVTGGQISANSDSVFSSNVSCTPLFAFSNVAASTTTGNIVDIVSNKKIRVLNMYCIASGTATNITFNSGATPITAMFTNGANGGEVLPYSPVGWFETAVGSGLTATTSAGSSTGVGVTYITV